MVRSLNEIVFDILEQYRANLKVTDSLDKRQVATWVQHLRAEFIKQRLEETFRNIDEHWVQDLGAVKMELVDSSIYTPIESGKTILRSIEDIPSSIQTRLGYSLTRVGPADMLSKKYNLVHYERALSSGNGKFNDKDIFAFMDGSKLCLISKANIHKLITYINIKGVFQNPIEAYEFANPNTPYDWDMEYPISESLISAIVNTIKEKNFRFALTPLEDDIQDGKDSLVNTNIRK